MSTQEKLLQFEKYLKNLGGQIPFYTKKKIMWRFHEIFEEELIGTESGDKWRKQFEK